MTATVISTPKTKLPFVEGQGLKNYNSTLITTNTSLDKATYKASIKLTGQKTQEETVFTYKFGEGMEATGRHYKRLAVAEEYLSGRNMTEWCGLVGIPEGTYRELRTECKKLGFFDKASDTSELPAEKLSKALPTARAVKEYTKANSEVKEHVEEKAVKGEISTAKEIKEKNKECIEDMTESSSDQSELTQETQNAISKRESITLEIQRLIEAMTSCQERVDSIHDWFLVDCEIGNLQQLVQTTADIGESLFNLDAKISNALAAKGSDQPSNNSSTSLG